MRAAVAAVGAAAVLALAGCSGGDGTTPAPTESETEAQVAPTEARTTEAAQQPQRQRPRTYTVKRGDTLSEIAERFDVTVRAIARANDIDDRHSIQVGQELRIPRGQ